MRCHRMTACTDTAEEIAKAIESYIPGCADPDRYAFCAALARSMGEAASTDNTTDFDRGYETGINAAVFVIRACSRHGVTPEVVRALDSIADLVEKMGEPASE